MFSKIGQYSTHYVAKIRENGLGAVVTMLGPVAVAGAHFLVSLLLIPHVSAADFGIFAFAMVLMQLGTGFSDGLLGSPMAVAQASARTGSVKHPLMVFACINLLYCTAFAVASFTILLWFTDSSTALLFSIFIMVMTFRWFGRAYLMITGNRKFVNRCDIFYSTSLIAAAGLVALISFVSLKLVVIIMLMAAIISTPCLGQKFFTMQWKAARKELIRDFIPIWKTQAVWSVVAVLANAATIESHVFVVTFIAGPESFAPIALAALFFRPTLIGIYALTQTERPKIAYVVARDGFSSAKYTVKSFVTITVTLWFLNAVLAGIISVSALHLVMNTSYDLATVQACIVSLAAVMLVRCIRQPVLTFLQATNQFRLVANITLYIAPLSLFLAAGGLWLAGSAGSILGLLVADIALLAAMVVCYRKTEDSSKPAAGELQ